MIYLVMVMIAYWSLLHASTNHTMNKMTMGRGTVMSLQVHIRQPDKDEGWEDKEDYVQSLKNKSQPIRKSFKKRSGTRQDVNGRPS